MSRREARRFGSYVIVGGVSLLSEYATFVLFYYAVGVPVVVANVIGFCIGLGVNFTLNRNWTFQPARAHRPHRQLVLFVIAALVNLAITSELLLLGKRHGIEPALAKPALMAMIAIWNYALLRNVIFRYDPH
jgi:putative flippase GtrA